MLAGEKKTKGIFRKDTRIKLRNMLYIFQKRVLMKMAKENLD